MLSWHACTGHLPAPNITSSLCRQHLRGSPCSRPGRVQRGALVIAMAADGKLTVTVTGAGGRTGKLVLKKLLAQPERYTARGLVRDEKVHALTAACIAHLCTFVTGDMLRLQNYACKLNVTTTIYKQQASTPW